MRNHMALPAVAGALMCLTATTARADTITLDDALLRAAKRPTIAIAGTEVDATRGDAVGARQPIYNPELGVALGPKRGGGETLFDFEIGVAQTIELGGKRAARRDAADARVAVAAAELDVAELEARLEVRRAFELALVARERLDATTEAEQLALEVQTAAKDTQDLGAGTQLRVNVAAAELGRARHDRIDAENHYESALSELAATIGAGPAERLEPAGTFSSAGELPWTEDELVARALATRPELGAAKARIEAASAEARLANALATPDLTVGVSYGYEQDPDATSHAVILSVSIALPVRTRNQGNRAAAKSRQHKATLEDDWLRVEVERAARLAFQNYERAREAVLGFDAEVNSHLRENLALARESFAAGKIDYAEFTVIRRELVASGLAYLDAVAEATEAWYAVQRAGGAEESP